MTLFKLVAAFSFLALPVVAHAGTAEVTTKRGMYPGEVTTVKSWMLRGGTKIQHEVTRNGAGVRTAWLHRVNRANGSFVSHGQQSGTPQRTVGGYLGGSFLVVHHSGPSSLTTVQNADGRVQSRMELPGGFVQLSKLSRPR